ncbi:MAG: type VI secretion system baseplate subunit TssG [Syntrophaceae bacterium]|nr:type VI secretion system baseplate subunit TssG [Syntrophaceae bacterium]
MAGQAGQSPADLTADLLGRGHEYAFVQVLRLMRLLGHDAETPGDAAGPAPGRRHLRIRPANSLGFPAADIAAVERTGGDEAGFRVTATFLGLYGPASPLPAFYTEDLLQDETSDESVTRDFLDIFNHRLFALFFRCALKYRLFFRVCEERSAEDLERLFCLLGLGEPGLRQGLADAQSLLRYIGIFTQHPRSALGLETMLRDAFPGVPVRVLPCCRRRVRIPAEQRLHLGRSGCRLGIDSVLGGEIEDRTGKIRLRVGPVDLGAFQRLLPGSRDHERIALLTRLYLQDPLERDVELVLAQGEARTTRLGGAAMSRLGLDTWVFSGERIGETSAVFPLQQGSAG